MRKLTFGFLVPVEFEMEVSEEEYEVMESHEERRLEAIAIMTKATLLAARNMDKAKMAPSNLHRDDISYVCDEDNNALYQYEY